MVYEIVIGNNGIDVREEQGVKYLREPVNGGARRSSNQK